MRIVKTTLAACAGLMLMAGTAVRAKPVDIHLAFVVPVANWAPLLVAKKDLAKHWGKSYELHAEHFRGTPSMITALANGELEVADLAFSSLGLAIQNAGLDDLRIVADGFQDGVPGYYSSQFFVRKDSGIDKIADLKGKVVATNIAGSGVDIGMKAAMKQHGLINKRDYTEIEAPFPAMPALLAEKKADLVTAVMPFTLNPTFKKIGKPLFAQKDGLGRSQFIIWVMRKSFIEKHRKAVVDFMEDVLRIERWYLDPKNNKQVAEIAGKILHQPASHFGWVFTHQDYYRDPDGLPDLKALQHNVDTAAELGFLKPGLDIAGHADLSMMKEAAARLKK